MNNTNEWDFHDEETQSHLHSLHPYPARFIPQIPNKAILKWTKLGDIVLDPFCGCGTTLLESSLLGRPSIGVDNNSVACLISRAKIQDYSKTDLNTLIKFENQFDNILDEVKLNIAWKPEYDNMGYWFDPQAISDLSAIREAINTLGERIDLFCLAIFSSIVVRVSNQESDTKYRRLPKEYQKGYAISLFKNKLKDMISRLTEVIGRLRAQGVVYHNDSRNIPFIGDNSIDLIVTSPPYLNAYDYHKYHRHRLHWIEGDVPFARDLEIGKHDTFTRKGATPDLYFEDMEKCFIECERVLKPGGRAFIVIGDAIVSGEPVPVGDTFINQCKDIGLKLDKRWIRKLQKSKKSFHQRSRIDEEHIILLRKE